MIVQKEPVYVYICIIISLNWFRIDTVSIIIDYCTAINF